MSPRSMLDWKPMSRTQFESRLRDEVAELPPDALKIYEACSTGLEEQPCDRDEQYGIESAFVIARVGVRVLMFDDVEDEFAVGIPDEDGVLRNWDLFGPLTVAVRKVAADHG
jgi:hypothetical protein